MATFPKKSQNKIPYQIQTNFSFGFKALSLYQNPGYAPDQDISIRLQHTKALGQTLPLLIGAAKIFD